ncbi:MAG: hypothetical protein H6718_05375 [Polyangiaceae bacterium]|nr:hypothetical protein [Myxococcales bacterium]MCB9584804.1 hypothetical protein [Polyangiaceae bacterium]MCB9607623.1 hypothetical protein [Polyangiaceae bacterium]
MPAIGAASSRLARRASSVALLLSAVVSAGAAHADDAPEPSIKDQGKAFVKELRELSDSCGIRRTPKPKASAPTSFSLILVASPFELAFYGDDGDLYAPLPTQSAWNYGGAKFKFPDLYKGLSLPKGKGWGKHKPTKNSNEYFARYLELGDKAAKLPLDLVRKMEVVRYTLDENGDGKTDTDDRSGTESSKSDASDDNTLIKHTYGTRLKDDGSTESVHDSEVLVRGVRVALDAGDDFDKRPKPLFVYTLSERFAEFDLNGDGDSEDELIFGDSDGDGSLSSGELDALYATGTGAEASLVGNLETDERFKAHGEGDAAVAGVLERVKQANPGFDNRAAKQFVLNAVVRAELNLYVEYDDPVRHARVRQHFGGAAAFRNAIMRIRGMTK